MTQHTPAWLDLVEAISDPATTAEIARVEAQGGPQDVITAPCAVSAALKALADHYAPPAAS